MEKCNLCKTKVFLVFVFSLVKFLFIDIKYIGSKSTNSVGLKPTGKKCSKEKQRGKCRGELHDSLLDWEDALPIQELTLSEKACKKADLCLCLGTSLQIMPCGNFPLLTKKNGGKIVMINLQKTKMDKHASLVIHSKLDDVFRKLFEKMKLSLNEFQEKIVLTSESLSEIDKNVWLSVDNIVIEKVINL